MYSIHNIFHLGGNQELKELYVSIAIRTFAVALAGIFLPVYLYQLGYSFASIFLFYLFASLFHIILLVPSAKVSSRFGVKHAMLFSMPFLIIFFLLLFMLDKLNLPLFVLAFFGGAHASFYWMSYHIDFSKFSNKRNRGKQLGIAKIVASVFGALGPLFGGIILFVFGFKILFIIVSFFLLISTAPLFLSKEIHEPMRFSVKGFFKDQKLRNIFAYIGNGIETRIGLVLWPLFIFIFILSEKYLSLGAVSSVAFLFAVGSTFIIGKFSDLNRRLVLKIGTVFNSVIWFLKSFVAIPLHVFIFDAFQGVSTSTMHIPFDAINYDKAKENKRIKIIMEREFYIHLGSIIFFVIMIFFSDYIVEAFRYGGPLASLMRFFF